MVSGSASCNGYAAPYILSGNAISFGESGPTTMMFCEGGGEKAFIEMMKRVTKYSIDADNKLNLIADDIQVMRFKKVEN